MKLGVIGDDFTGSGDIANTLAKAGARTVQYVGILFAHLANEIDAVAAEELEETAKLVPLTRRLPVRQLDAVLVAELEQRRQK